MFKSRGRTTLIFLGLILSFVIALFIVTALTNNDNSLIFYQPVFYFGVYSILFLFIAYDLSRLNKPLPENTAKKLAVFAALKESSVLGFVGFILKARILMASIVVLVMLPAFAKVVWRMVLYLIDCK